MIRVFINVTGVCIINNAYSLTEFDLNLNTRSNGIYSKLDTAEL